MGAIIDWFGKLIIKFFFNIDRVIYAFIIKVYDLLIAIARTSILTQGDIADMTGRIYKLLTLFMIFKVTLSLITYTVSPDNFSDKSKGIGKLAQNIVISLCMLILTPYIFNYAYKLQTIILESNALAVLIFDEDDNGGLGDNNVLNTAGETIAYTTINAFFVPNSAIGGLYNCVNLMKTDGTGKTLANPECTGLDNTTLDPTNTSTSKTMNSYIGNGGTFDQTMLKNYVAGLNNRSMGLVFRQELATATVIDTTTSEEVLIMDYSYILSTVTGVVILFMLITFCIDVSLRSIKLAFLQIIAPIPIITYVDPKSGKDGMFMKWVKMCGSTFVGLFIRLLAIYFAIYLISRVGNMVDIINGTTVTNHFIKIFVIIGALMFAKQLPEILKGLGVNLDGGGKFTLNPLKKIEEGALGGKRITGAMAGMAIGALGNKGNPFKAFGGAIRGFAGGKGLSAAAQHQANVNRQLRQAKLDGSTFGGRMNARWQDFSGAKGFNNVDALVKQKESLDKVASAASDAESTAVEKIKNNEAGDISKKYHELLARAEKARNEGRVDDAVRYQYTADNYLNNAGKYNFMDVSSGKVAEDTFYAFGADGKVLKDDLGNVFTSTGNVGKNGTLESKIKTYERYASDAGEKVHYGGEAIHGHLGDLKGRTSELDRQTSAAHSSNEADRKYVQAAKMKK